MQELETDDKQKQKHAKKTLTAVMYLVYYTFAKEYVLNWRNDIKTGMILCYQYDLFCLILVEGNLLLAC